MKLMMLRTCVWAPLLTMLALGLSDETYVRKPWPLPSGPKIFGGTEPANCAYPFQILVVYDGFPICGGSIINEYTVLTAAHCLDHDPRPVFYDVIAGEHNPIIIEGTEQRRKITNIIMHTKYNETSLDNDVALLNVDQPFMFDNCVKPVNLSDTTFDQEAFRLSCDTSGWGTINNQDKTPETLLSVRVTLVTNQKCNRKLSQKKLPNIPGSSVCTVDHNKGTCYGDSGGPMGCYGNDGVYRQIGVTSWGPYKCNQPPNVFVRVSSFLTWIEIYTFLVSCQLQCSTVCV